MGNIQGQGNTEQTGQLLKNLLHNSVAVYLFISAACISHLVQAHKNILFLEFGRPHDNRIHNLGVPLLA